MQRVGMVFVTSLLLGGCFHLVETTVPSQINSPTPTPSPGFVIPSTGVSESEENDAAMFDQMERLMDDLDEELKQLDVPEEF